MPGSLDVADIFQLCPANADPFKWAEEHLRAITDKAFPTLVPARLLDGACHWLYEGRCLVHENAPYGCAFFDTHMSPAESDKRSAATIQARQEDARNNGIYHRIWVHLCRLGLTAPSGDRTALGEEFARLRSLRT